MTRKDIQPPSTARKAPPSVPAPVAAPRPSRFLPLALSLVLAIATVAVYARVRSYGFIEYDDNCYVYDNPTVKAGLTPSGVAWAFTTFHGANWHPLTWLSHMLDVTLFGKATGAYHLVNLAFHTASAVLLFLAFFMMTARPWRSFIVAGVFALHPIHVESVAWIAERKDVLSTFFAALALVFYVRYARRPSFLRYLPLILSLVLGLMAKSMLVTLPFVFLLMDLWPLSRLSMPLSWRALRPRVYEKLPLFAVIAASSVVTFIAQRSGGAVSSLTRLPLSDRLATAVTAYTGYIAKSLLPAHLGVLYPYAAHSAQVVSVALLVLLALTAAAVVLVRTRPYLLVGWLMYLGMLVPVIGLVQVGAQSMADRYAYLPLVGLSLAAVWLAADLAAPVPLARRAVFALACVMLLAFAAFTWRQVGYWSSSKALFERTLAVTERNYFMHKCLAAALDAEGRADEAKAHYLASLAIKPDFAESHNGLGLVLDREGRHDEALAHYQAALASQGGLAEAYNNMGVLLERQGRLADAKAQYEKAVAARASFPGAQKNLAVLLAREGNSAEAVVHYRAALAADPDYAEAHNNLGVLLAREGQSAEALAHYRQALSLKPDYPEARANLGHELLRAGKLDEAFAQLDAAVKADPKLFEAQADLGTLLAAQGKLDDARARFEESLRLSPDQPGVHSNLAFVLTNLGRPDEAISHCREALRLRPGFVDAHYNLGMALLSKGMQLEASAEFSTVLSLSPSHPGARAALDSLRRPAN